ncbi:MAG: hypothetical protein M0P11_08095, partial [Anaerolineaceae bacterium]|nr:hypothetical protein [Anaerolineaceae bacterium]
HHLIAVEAQLGEDTLGVHQRFGTAKRNKAHPLGGTIVAASGWLAVVVRVNHEISGGGKRGGKGGG